MGYTKSVLSGFTGQSGLKVASNALAVIKVAILARLLTPDDFGLFSLTMIALGLSEAATQTGVNLTILQAKQTVNYFINTAWVIAIIRGFVIGVVMIALAFILSRYFNQPQLLFLITWASLVPMIKGFINPAIIRMQKELAFVADTSYRLVLTTFEAVITIVLVMLFDSVFAWITAIVLTAVIEVLISQIFVKPRPRFEYQASRAKTILQNAKGLGLQSFLSYLTENMDNLIIGKINGTFNLGLYQPTYALAHELNYEVAKSFNHASLPVYTKITEDKKRLRRAFFRAGAAAAGLALLISLPFLIAPALIIRIIFGEQWGGAVELLPWLVIAGWLQALGMIGYSLLLATKRIKAMNIHLGVSFVLMVVCMTVLGLEYGLLGAVIGLVLSRLLALPVLAWSVRQELRSS